MSRRFSVRRYEQPDVVTRLVETSAAMFVETTAAPTSSARTRTLRGHTVVEPSENLVFSHGERRYRLSPAYAKHLRGEGVLLLWKPRHAPLQAPTETPKPKETPKPIVFEHEVVDATVGDPREFSKSVPPTWRGVREARVSVSAVACPRNWVWEEVSWDFTYRVIVGTETAFSWSGNGLRTKGQTRNTDDPVPVANSNEARRIPFSPSPDGGVTLKIIGDQSTVRFVRDGKNVAETFPFRLKHVRITLEPIMEFEEVLRVGFQGTTRLAIPQGRVDSVPTLEPSEVPIQVSVAANSNGVDELIVIHNPARPPEVGGKKQGPEQGVLWRYWAGRAIARLRIRDSAGTVTERRLLIDVGPCTRDEFLVDIETVNALAAPSMGNDTSDFRSYFANTFASQAWHLFPELRTPSADRAAFEERIAEKFAALGVTYPNGTRWDRVLAAAQFVQ